MDGKAMAFKLPWLWIIVVFGVQITPSLSQGPNDVVATVNSDVNFTYTNNAIQDTDYYYWYRITPLDTIYSMGDPQPANPNKYSVNNNNSGTFSLTVMDVTTDDGRTYCFYSAKTRNASCANLVVIDDVIPSINPPNGVSVGQMANLTCQVDYGSTTTDKNNIKALSPDQEPQLSMLIGNTPIPDVPPGQEIIGSDERTHTKSISVNRTIMTSDIGQYLVCQVTTKNPAYSYSWSTFLNVINATTYARIQYMKNQTANNGSSCCQIGDILNCTANGFPFPTITWKTSNGNNIQPSASGNGFAAITITMMGTYTLNCSARYNATSIPYNDTITVNPGGMQNGTSQESKSENKVALGVGLGIGLGVPVLIGLIVLIVILSRRKKSAKPITVKQPETKTKAGQTGKAPVSNNGKGPGPGSRNNVNPNPNPTYQTPVMPEQTGTVVPKNVRDSPGYGDLGVRHLGGSGSNPHLNESFDSQADKSLDSSRSNRASGNLQFTGGKTSHSPSAPNTSV